MSGDIVERLRAEVVPCPGRGWDGNGVQHCAECCFGTGVDAATADELRVMVLARDAADEIVRLRDAGDALAAIVGDVVVPYDDESKARTMVTAYDTWLEASRG